MSFKRLLLLVAALALASPSRATAEPILWNPVAIVDTLGLVSTETRFSIFGSSGIPFFGLHPFGSEFIGPEFTLTEPSYLTSVGGFVNSCESIQNGVQQCTPASAITVQIRPAIGLVPNAGPDPNSLIASYELSHDDDPLTVSFESASFQLLLEPGTYYALFALPAGEGGTILTAAQSPFPFRASETTLGRLDPGTGFSAATAEDAAVRVTAAPVPEPSTLSLLLAGAAAGALRRRQKRTAAARQPPCAA